MKPILITIGFITLFSIAKAQQPDTAYRKLYTPVNQEARYRGGDAAFFKFFLKNFKYPKIGESYFGKIIIEFTIEKDGSITDIHVSPKLPDELNAEIIRVMKLSPKWSPRILDGRPKTIAWKVPINLEPGMSQ